MIPVPNNIRVTSLLEYNEIDKKYKDLISAEYRYINSNKEEKCYLLQKGFTI